jgi:hypothetical protein
VCSFGWKDRRHHAAGTKNGGDQSKGKQMKFKVIGAVVAAVVLGVGSGVAATTLSSPNGSGESSPAAPAPLAIAAAVDVGQTEVYTAITPCRILDTRATSPIVAATRDFKVSGTLSPQGGSNTCGIPATATSIAVNLTGISTGGTGFVRGWAAGGAPVNATLLNFSPALNASNMVNLPLCKGGGCTNAFTLQVFGGANIIGDVIGYYQAPMYAKVDIFGNLMDGVSSGLVSIEKVDTGQFTLTFDRPVDKCAVTTADVHLDNTRDVSADATYGPANAVEVSITNAAGTYVDTYFYVAVHC